ncbi:hypothetical protein BKA65DRAFT_504466 [Rhexocercosporidium sp. MPI-PUGE-AT-0058]|nr:hypothetical protein BKA65DRAFT_504466 [Rhexocercosporidium sp. MPI-PUGE-AT-0058]
MVSRWKEAYRKVKNLKLLSQNFTPEEIEDILRARVERMSQRQFQNPCIMGADQLLDGESELIGPLLRRVQTGRPAQAQAPSVGSQRATVVDRDPISPPRRTNSHGSSSSQSSSLFRRLLGIVSKPVKRVPAWEEMRGTMRPWTEFFEAEAVGPSRWAHEMQATLEETAQEVAASLRNPRVPPLHNLDPEPRALQFGYRSRTAPTSHPAERPLPPLPRSVTVSPETTPLSRPDTASSSSASSQRSGALRRMNAVKNLRQGFSSGS